MNDNTPDPPFTTPGSPPRVAVSQGHGPYDNAREALSHFDLTEARGRKVLVKPNAGRIASPDSGVVTNPQVVAAVIDAFLEAGAAVSVGESPITGVTTMEAFESSGIAAIARQRNVPLLDMDEGKPVRVKIPNGKAIKVLRACPHVMNHELVVSVPVMKTHMHTGVTLSIKNMKGCLWRRSKIALHMLPLIPDCDDKPLNVAIADMASVLRPHFSVVDGTVGMEGLGPSAGEAKPFGVIVAGSEPFAVDAVACSLMGLKAEEIPHLRIVGERGYGTLDLEKIDITPRQWREWTQPFCASPDGISFKFPNVEVLDNNSCSACQSTVLLFLKRYQHEVFDYFPPDTPLHIAIGKGHEEVPEGTLCVGNCTLRHRDRGTYVPGCPPVASAILNAVKAKKK